MAKGYSFAALVDVLYPVYKTTLGDGVNLDDFNSFARVGVYVQVSNSGAAGGSNYPEPSAGCLEVLPNAGGVIQRYTVYTGNNATYVRSYYNGAWGVWKKYLTDNVIYNTVYPVGICVQFDANVNPNTAFPGTTWAQIVDGRQVRAAENAAAIGTTGGSDTVVLAEANLPAHTHTVATHSHTISTHLHKIGQHNHLVDSHAHKMTHGHTASSVADGAHTHLIANGTDAPRQPGSSTLAGSNHLALAYDTGNTRGYSLIGSPNTPDRGLTNSAGSHAHTITVNDMSGYTDVASPRTDTSGATETETGGPTATGTGGPSATGSVGSGTAVAVAGAWHKYAIWKRTA